MAQRLPAYSPAAPPPTGGPLVHVLLGREKQVPNLPWAAYSDAAVTEGWSRRPWSGAKASPNGSPPPNCTNWQGFLPHYRLQLQHHHRPPCLYPHLRRLRPPAYDEQLPLLRGAAGILERALRLLRPSAGSGLRGLDHSQVVDPGPRPHVPGLPGGPRATPCWERDLGG